MAKDIIFENKDDELVRAVLVAVYSDTSKLESELDELASLLETAGGVAAVRMVQYRPSPDNATYIGKGKLDELKDICKSEEIELVVFDDELSPSQIREIENALGDVRVIDRTMLILDIFARNADTNEGILQVQIARLKYTIPRLRGHGTEMSRLGGGIGTRGPGETKLESDKRHVKSQIANLERELEALEKRRLTQRKTREKSGVVQIAVAGYTNVGKSTLLNRLTGADILAENKLFATLDPTTRRWALESGEVVITDTVGFIKNLPHHLVEAFKSTLAEVVYSDIILVVLDASSPDVKTEYDVTLEIIHSLIEKHKVEEKPIIYVFNKIDALGDGALIENTLGIGGEENAVFISARTGEGIDELERTVEALILKAKKETVFLFPHADAGRLDALYKNSKVISVEYTTEGVLVRATVDEKTRGQNAKFILDEGR